jgi:hypothetical protein
MFLVISYPVISRILTKIYDQIEINGTIYKYMNKYASNSYKPLHVLLDIIDKNETINNNSNVDFNELDDDINTKPLEKTEIKPFFNQINFNVNVVSFLAIIVTVGVINPLLGLLMCICLSINIHTDLSVMGNHLKNTKNEHQRQQLLDIYERDCKGLIETIRLCKIILLPTMGIFYAPFIVDIIGTAIGYNFALIPFCHMIFTPLELWLIKEICKYIYNNFISQYCTNSNNNNKRNSIITRMSINGIEDRNISIENPLL